MEKKNFALNDRVVLRRLGGDKLEGVCGNILGKSHEHITDTYIVLLDKPTETHLAICLTESCIDRIE